MTGSPGIDCGRFVRRIGILGGSLALVATSSAHHSYAMFDRTTVGQVEGTVARFDWTNPHVFLWVYVAHTPGKVATGDSDAKYVLFGFEGGSPGSLIRNGWSKNTFVAGEKVIVFYNPLKDGRNGGSFAKAQHADGSISATRLDTPGPEAAKGTP